MEEQLERAIGLYESLLAEYRSLERCLTERRVEAVYETMAEMRRLMEEIDALCGELSAGTGVAAPGAASAHLFSEFRRLAGEAGAANRSLGEKTRAIMAVVSDEIRQARRSRQAVSGYGPAGWTGAARIDKAC